MIGIVLGLATHSLTPTETATLLDVSTDLEKCHCLFLVATEIALQQQQCQEREENRKIYKKLLQVAPLILAG